MANREKKNERFSWADLYDAQPLEIALLLFFSEIIVI